MRPWCVLLVVLLSGAQAAQALPPRHPAAARIGDPYTIDPVTFRIWAFCDQKPSCIQKQHQGIQMFLGEITREPRPTMEAIHRCTERATKKTFTDWPAAARCLR